MPMPTKEKYTIIHLAYVGRGHYVPKMERIETGDLTQYILDKQRDPHFIFVGWPKLEGEEPTNEHSELA